MRFTKPFWDGIAEGTITTAFRGWTRPTVVVGRPYRTGGGRIEVTAVDKITPDSITKVHAKRAGYSSVDEVLANVRLEEGRDLYRIAFRVINEPDPREVLAAAADLTDADVANIMAKLDRLDRSSKKGPWTRATLALVADHPERRAPDLAEMVGRETQPFKLDVRKLKNMGLTHSLKIGYTLSPRGKALLERLEKPLRDTDQGNK